MEFAAAAMTAVGSATAGGASAAGASAGLMSAAGATSGWASILSGGATVASVLAKQRAGEQQGRALEFQAADADMSSRLESIQGLDRRNSMKAALVRTVGERDVAVAASGVDLSFGTPMLARAEAIKDGDLALSQDFDTENFRKARLAERAANLRSMASQARAGGLASAAGLALEGGAKLLRRG